MFHFIQKLRLKKQVKASVNDFHALWETDFDDIWRMDIKNNLLVALNGWLCKKSNYGENIGNLSGAEKTFYLIFQLESEVNNGGFSQYYYNSSGDFANDIAAALRDIGAYKTADLCDKALAAFGGALPKNRDEREALLDSAFTDEIEAVLRQCDTDFCSCPDDLVALNYNYVMAKRGQFTR